MRKWIANHKDMDTSQLYRQLYDNAVQYVQPQSIPPMIILLAEYQYKNAFVADPELNMVACLTEIMSECKFK